MQTAMLEPRRRFYTHIPFLSMSFLCHFDKELDGFISNGRALFSRVRPAVFRAAQSVDKWPKTRRRRGAQAGQKAETYFVPTAIMFALGGDR